MCANLALVFFLVMEMFMNNASGVPTMKEQEINLKLRLMVPDRSPMVSYPSIIHTPTSSLNNPLFSAYHSIQPPQPPVPPMPPLNLRLQPSAVLTQQQLTYENAPINRWGGFIRPARSRNKPSLVIHQPVVNYHYTPSSYVPPTRLVPIQVPVHIPASTISTPTKRPIIIVSGFNAGYGLNYSYSNGGSTTTTPKPLVDFAELLKELKAGFDEKPEIDTKTAKPIECPCNDTDKEFDLLKDPFFKDKNPYDIGKLNLGKLDDDDYDDDDLDDYDDVDDLPSGKVAAVRNMWGGYVPKSLLRGALRKPTPKHVAESQVAPKRSPSRKRRIRKGMNKILLKQFQNGLNALQETIKANENDKDIENAIKELHDSDYDDSEDNEENESHLTHFVDFWGNRVPKYQNDLKDREQTVQESAAEYNKDPNGWNPKYTNGLWSEDDKHLQVFSGYQHKPEEEEHHEGQVGEARKEYHNGLGEGLAANYNKYVTDNGTWLAGHYNPAGVDMSHIFNESVANERPLDNPSETYDTYEKVVDFLNGRMSKNDTVSTTVQPAQSASDLRNTTAALGVGSGEMISVKDLLAVLVEKKKEREENETKADDAKKEEDKEDGLDSEEDKSEYVLAENTNIPADMIANIGKPPDGALCTGITNVGVANNDTNNETQMSHVRGFSCVKDYDEEEGDGDDTEDKTNEDKDDEEKNIEQSIEKSQEGTA